MMRKTAYILFAVLLSSPAWTADLAYPRLITVSGEATVNVVPDEVVLTIGIETSNKNLGTAKSQNDKVVKEVLAAAKEQKIESKYIQTDFFTIEPRYDYNSESKYYFAGYFVRKNIVIKLKDLSRYEDLLSAVLNSGVNYVHGIQFKTTQLRKFRDQARVMAVQAAKDKAALLSGELGLKLKKAYTISEDYGGMWSWYNNSWTAWQGNQSRNYSQNMTQNAMSGGTGSSPEEDTIAPGQIAVTSRVSVSFELE